MIGIWALSGIIRRTASRVVVPLAVQSSVCFSNHVVPSIKANNSTDLSGRLFYRLFSLSLNHYPKLIFQDLSMLGLEDEDFLLYEQAISFEIEERPNQHTLVLNYVLSEEQRGEISNIEIHMPDAVIGEQDDDKEANQSSIPFVIRASYDTGTCLEICCTSYLDKICFDHMSAVKDSSVSNNQIDLYMIENLLKTYHMIGIKPCTIYYLHELKLELNEFKKSFVKLSQELNSWTFLSSVLDYSRRRCFDIKLIDPWERIPYLVDDDGMLEQMQIVAGKLVGYEHRSSEIFVLTRKCKDETICIELLTQSISDYDWAGKGKQSVIPFIFNLSNDKGMCLEFSCAAYPGKISLNELHVIDDWKSRYLIAEGGPEEDLEDYKNELFECYCK